MNLAMIRKAAQMTQVEVARKLGVGQGVVSRLEHRDDMLLSTLYDYLMATGAEAPGIVVIVNGHRIELDLRPPPQPARTAIRLKPSQRQYPQHDGRLRDVTTLGLGTRAGLLWTGHRLHRTRHGRAGRCPALLWQPGMGGQPLLRATALRRRAGFIPGRRLARRPHCLSWTVALRKCCPLNIGGTGYPEPPTA